MTAINLPCKNVPTAQSVSTFFADFFVGSSWQCRRMCLAR